MTAPAIVAELVDRFDAQRDSYRAGTYNETQLRREFLDPFFEALGWDVYNRKGYAEAYKEVIHEDAIKIGGHTKAPDYCFRAGGGMRSFFVEAKKPAVDIREAVHPAFQLRRYAWSAKLPVSILTDFEELAVYDCRIRPQKTDKAIIGRIRYHTYVEYPERWDELYGLFSPEAIRRGSLEKLVASKKIKKGTAEVDAAFLEEIESWRDVLARNIALRNPGLSPRDLNFAVQRTIDRLVFLRICEDRGIEPYGRLQGLANGPGVYRRLGELFQQADQRYNSGLFYFNAERDRGEPPDQLTLGLSIDDRPLREILANLYYPESPYEFSVLPAEILGQVYEQFLGKVIRLTKGGQAKVEEKPEVRKAGGVYYTPAYIVEYIVNNTVGKLLEGTFSPGTCAGRGEGDEGRGARNEGRGVAQSLPSPSGRGGGGEGGMAPKEAAKLRILDPACGSGSFLIGAYQHLLDWHRDWYVAHDAERHARGRNPVLYRGAGGQWRLTTAERKRILLNNIYGVDIDPQAVEVTKLSLLLKVLEGESDETISNQLRLFHERALPDLAANVKCGNSLIGPDFYEGRQLSVLDDEERYRINVFDWQAEFPTVFSPRPRSGRGAGGEGPAGGFDAVIGNPPYGFHQIHSEQVKPYLKDHFDAAQGSFEHYFLFYEKSLRLLRAGGIHSFIAPVTWLTIPSARSLRVFILANFAIREVCWLPELVFAEAQVNTLISIIEKSPADLVEIFIHSAPGFQSPPKEHRKTKQSDFVASDYYIAIFENDTDRRILAKMDRLSQPLAGFARPCSGYNPYEVGKGERPGGGLHTQQTVAEKPYHSEKRIGTDWKPEIVGRDLSRYHVNVTGRRWIKYGPWLAAARDPANFIGKRLLVQEITGGKERRIVAAYYDGELYHSRDVIPVKAESCAVDPRYLLGIMNSRLITWHHHRRNPKAQKGLFPKVLVSDLKKLPIRQIDRANSEDCRVHDRLVQLVDTMLALHRQLAAARTANDKTLIQRQIEATDRQIDRLVYDLYGLTDAEIAIVEGAT